MLDARRHRGQATVELAIIAAALVPLLLVVSHMARICDITHATRQASQFLVWNAALLGDMSLVNANQRASDLFLSAPISSAASDSNPQKAPRHYWVDTRGEPLTETPPLRSEMANSTLSEVQRTLGHAIRPFSSGLKLSDKGMLRAKADVAVAPLRSTTLEPFGTIDLSGHAESALFTGSWAAQNGGEVKTRLADWRVTTPDPLLTPSVRLLASLFHAFGIEANPSSFRNRNVDPDTVPCDLLTKKGRPTC